MNGCRWGPLRPNQMLKLESEVGGRAEVRKDVRGCPPLCYLGANGQGGREQDARLEN